MLLTYLPAAVMAAEKHTHDYTNGPCSCGAHGKDHTGWTPWTSTTSLPKEAGCYYLTKDVTLSSGWNVPVSTTDLCLNGCVIRLSDDAVSAATGTDFVISIDGGAVLKIYDCDCRKETDRTHEGYTDANGLWHPGIKKSYERGELEQSVVGGVITGGRGSEKGGAVCLHDDNTNKITNKFVLYGGTIAGNSAVYSKGSCGGGVYVGKNAEFVMSGGTIKWNTADNGGGVYNGDGTFTVYGGDIVRNKAVKGGGVFVKSSGKLNLTAEGGKSITITNNAASGYGPGGVLTYGITRMSGCITIKNNTSPMSGSYTIDGIKKDIKVPQNFAALYYNDYPIQIVGDLFGSEINISIADDKNDGNKVHHYSPEKSIDKSVPLTFGYMDNSGAYSGSGSEKYFHYEGIDGYELVLISEELFVAKPGTEQYVPSYNRDDDDLLGTITVPVSNEINTVNVDVFVSGNTAEITNLTYKELLKVSGSDAALIDFTGLKRTIDSARIPTETVEKLGNRTGMSIKLSEATLSFDQTAVKEIASQAKGETVQFTADEITKGYLNTAQRNAVEKLNAELILDAHLISNGTRLCEENKGGFGGGKVSIKLPCAIKNDRNASYYRVYYVDDRGNLENVNAVYDATQRIFTFDVTHFSNYVVAYDINSVSACLRGVSCPAAKFTDLDLKEWYHDGIHYCAARGLINGTSDTEFEPNATISRAEIVTMLWRLEGKPYVNYYMQFKDVPAEEYYTEAVRWAASEKIFDGYDTYSFGPEDEITREQLAAIIYRYVKTKGESLPGSEQSQLPFGDAADISDWANEAVRWCYMKKIVGGADGSILPQGTATRAEAAVMMQRFCERDK